ncbi:MAG: hypothetical protein V1743_05520 [Nanoarchaeota archaeon]
MRRTLASLQKGQAALEFLVTYGWAFMILIIVISSLAYFGVISPDLFLPEKCVFGGGIYCRDFAGIPDSTTPDNGKVRAQLVNSIGSTLQVIKVEVDCTTITCTPCVAGAAPGDYWCGLGISTYWAADEQRELIIRTPGLKSSDRPKIDVTITYKKPTDYFEKELTGVIAIRSS